MWEHWLHYESAIFPPIFRDSHLELKKFDIGSRDVIIIESYENTEFVVFVNSYRQYNHGPIHFFCIINHI